MKTCLLFLSFLLIFAACEKQADSITIDTGTLCADTVSLASFTSEPFQTVYFLNDSTGFTGDSKGGIYKTTDGGSHWVSQVSGVALPINSILFLDAQTGFAAGGGRLCAGNGCTADSGFILKTTNGGTTWKHVYSPAINLEVRSLCFPGQTTGFAVSGTTVLKTTDAGQSWQEYTLTDLHTTMMQVQFSDPQRGYIACGFDDVVITKDGGISWQVQHPRNNDTFAYYNSLSVIGNTIYVAGAKEMIKSTDGGASWQVLHLSPADIFAVHFINASTGYALGRGNYSGGDFGYSYGSFYCTHDGGNTWEGTADMIKQPLPGFFTSASFPSDSVGYAFKGNQLIRLSLQ